MSWKVHAEGSTVTVKASNGETVATVGSKDDFRILTRLRNARLIAAAPEMEDLLMDLHSLLRRESISEENYELAQLLEKVNDIYHKVNAAPTRKDTHETIKEIIQAKRDRSRGDKSVVVFSNQNTSPNRIFAEPTECTELRHENS